MRVADLVRAIEEAAANPPQDGEEIQPGVVYRVIGGEPFYEIAPGTFANAWDRAARDQFEKP